MIQSILEKLSQDPDAIVRLLEFFQCSKIKVGTKEIRFARDDKPQSGLNISIKLNDNQSCFVHDFARNEKNNIISWICKEKNIEFREVINAIKKILNLNDDWNFKSKHRDIFGGVYSKIINKQNFSPKTYPDDILNNYLNIGNELWQRDGINLHTQKLFNVCFDIENNSIIFPWRNDRGEIIAIKSRYNGTPPDGMSKYYYPIGGNISYSLYGYSENYEYLYGNTVYIGESEKFTQQLATMGYRNAVSLGSNSLSERQAKLLLSLRPKQIFWMLDEGLDKEYTIKNAEMIKNISSMINVPQFWWNYDLDIDITQGSKVSPGDLGKEKFDEIIKEQMEQI